jgi:hypothetical protein
MLFADAEGNGDSISPSVQAERVALLTNALTSTLPPNSPAKPLAYSLTAPTSMRPMLPASLTPPPRRAVPTPFYGSNPPPGITAHAVTRARSQFDLRSGYMSRGAPIYQTSGRPSPVPASAYAVSSSSVPPSPLLDMPGSYASFGPYPDMLGERAYLPSFLTDMMASPALSTSSSADLSSLEDLSLSSPGPDPKELPHSPTGVSMGGGVSSIWGLDGTERQAWHDLRTRQSQEALIVR